MSTVGSNPISWWRTDIGNDAREELLLAFDQRRFTMSSSVQKVEALVASILKVPYVVLTNSGSSSLLMSLLALDITKDDEVIVPSLTWIATAQAPAILGAKVIPCDVLEDEPLINTDLIESLITPKTKAIIPVHYNGRYANIEKLKVLANKYGLSIIEDSCKGLFSKKDGQYFGTLGDVGCFSLGMISPVSIGFGGIAVTKDKTTYEKLLMIRDHGVNRQPEEYSLMGYNFKISDLLASLAITQFINYESTIKSLVELHNYYQNNLNSEYVSNLNVDKAAGSVPVYVEGYSESREDLVSYLGNHNVQVSKFHLPVNAAAYLGSSGNDFLNASRFSESAYILPSGPSQSYKDIDRVLNLLNRY